MYIRPLFSLYFIFLIFPLILLFLYQKIYFYNLHFFCLRKIAVKDNLFMAYIKVDFGYAGV